MFQSKISDGPAQWERLRDLVQGSPPGTLFDFDVLTEAIECSRDQVSAIVFQLNKKMPSTGIRLVSVPSRGYAVATAGDKLREATLVRPKKIQRQVLYTIQAAESVLHGPDASPDEQESAMKVATESSSVLLWAKDRSRMVSRMMKNGKRNDVSQSGMPIIE